MPRRKLTPAEHAAARERASRRRYALLDKVSAAETRLGAWTTRKASLGWGPFHAYDRGPERGGWYHRGIAMCGAKLNGLMLQDSRVLRWEAVTDDERCKSCQAAIRRACREGVHHRIRGRCRFCGDQAGKDGVE